jgi:flagellar P-ring protein precursor FlgI
MHSTLNILLASVTTLVMLAISSAASAVQIQDMVRIKGAESSKIVGMGLVVGLNGTGDGNKSLSTMRRLSAMMNNLGDPAATALELKDAKNVAVVYLTAKLPSSGVREGDELDVEVAAPVAQSLAGGRLVLTPLVGPLPNSPIFAFAEGTVSTPDAKSPATGVVKAGATLTRDVYAQFLDDYGRMTLVIDPANATWPMANTLATMVNDVMASDQAPIAYALDPKNIVIQVPPQDRANPSAFISQVLEIQLDPTLVRTEARVIINRKTGTIVMTENVQLSPVVISHKGMTITTSVPPRPIDPAVLAAAAANGEAPPRDSVALDPNTKGAAKLADLLNAFNQLKVPADDRIAILKEIHRSGKLHAQLILED